MILGQTGNACSICLEEIDSTLLNEKPVVILGACKHVFHCDCLHTVIHLQCDSAFKCPNCRVSLLPGDIDAISNSGGKEVTERTLDGMNVYRLFHDKKRLVRRILPNSTQYFIGGVGKEVMYRQKFEPGKVDEGPTLVTYTNFGHAAYGVWQKEFLNTKTVITYGSDGRMLSCKTPTELSKYEGVKGAEALRNVQHFTNAWQDEYEGPSKQERLVKRFTFTDKSQTKLLSTTIYQGKANEERIVCKINGDNALYYNGPKGKERLVKKVLKYPYKLCRYVGERNEERLCRMNGFESNGDEYETTFVGQKGHETASQSYVRPVKGTPYTVYYEGDSDAKVLYKDYDDGTQEIYVYNKEQQKRTMMVKILPDGGLNFYKHGTTDKHIVRRIKRRRT